MTDLLEQFVVVLPGILAAIMLYSLVGSLLNVTEGKNRPKSDQWRSWGLAVGVVAGLVFSILRSLAIVQQRTAVNIPTLICCCIFDAALLVVLCCSGRIKASCEAARAGGVPNRYGSKPYILANAIIGIAVALGFFRAIPNIVLQLTDFILPNEPVFTSDMLMRALGFVLGIVVAAVAAFIFRGNRRAAPKPVFKTIVIVFAATVLLQHAVSLAQVLQSTHRVAFSGTAFKVLAWFINHSHQVVIGQAAIFLIPAIFAVIRAARLNLEAPIPAVVRAKKKFRRLAYSWGSWTLAMVVVVTLTLTVGYAKAHEEPVLSEPEAYELTDTVATIDISIVEDGHLHRFEYEASDGTVMRFIVIQKGGGAYGVGLDACENCGAAGYFEQDGKIICKQCNVAINLATIGSPGGCNPIPLEFELNEHGIQIQTAALDELSSAFS